MTLIATAAMGMVGLLKVMCPRPSLDTSPYGAPEGGNTRPFLLKEYEVAAVVLPITESASSRVPDGQNSRLRSGATAIVSGDGGAAEAGAANATMPVAATSAAAASAAIRRRAPRERPPRSAPTPAPRSIVIVPSPAPGPHPSPGPACRLRPRVVVIHLRHVGSVIRAGVTQRKGN